MVVRYNDVHAILPAERNFVNGGNAVIHGDDQINPVFAQPLDRMRMHAVAVLVTGRNEAFYRRSHAAELPVQDCGGANPIRIIIAIDADAVMGLHRLDDPLQRRFHIRQQHGVMQSGA